MAKLNKMEITAIAEDIISKIKVNKAPISFKEWRKEYYETPEGKHINGLIKQSDILSKQLGEYNYESSWGGINKAGVNCNCTLESIALYKYNKKYPKKESPKVSDIIRELIIAQAKNTDVDAMIASILEKYK